MSYHAVLIASLHLISISFILIKFVKNKEVFLSKLFLFSKDTVLAFKFAIGGISLSMAAIICQALLSPDHPLSHLFFLIGSLHILIFYLLIIKVQVHKEEV